MPALMLPENYKYTILGVVVLPFVANMVIGGPVMAARKAMNVPYPNLYATPGVHDKADAFNRIQRGHQNMFETVRAALKISTRCICLGVAAYKMARGQWRGFVAPESLPSFFLKKMHRHNPPPLSFYGGLEGKPHDLHGFGGRPLIPAFCRGLRCALLARVVLLHERLR
jgi:hypothetical protein